MRLKLSVVSCVTLMYCVWSNRCVRVFPCVSNTKFLVERWHQSGRVMKGVVNGVLFVIVLLTSVVYCTGIFVE
jgi:hypothetical protein